MGNKILNVFLMPADLYRKLTGKKTSLYLGIIFVGVNDMAFDYIQYYQKFFVGKSQGIFLYNVTLAIVFALLIGFIDVMFFSIPIFDLFKFFRRDGGAQDGNDLMIKVMKVYILANIILLPINIIGYLVGGALSKNANSYLLGFTALALLIITFIWFAAVITRGLSYLYNLDSRMKNIAFIVIVVWNFLLATAFKFLIDRGMVSLLR